MKMLIGETLPMKRSKSSAADGSWDAKQAGKQMCQKSFADRNPTWAVVAKALNPTY